VNRMLCDRISYCKKIKSVLAAFFDSGRRAPDKKLLAALDTCPKGQGRECFSLFRRTVCFVRGYRGVKMPGGAKDRIKKLIIEKSE